MHRPELSCTITGFEKEIRLLQRRSVTAVRVSKKAILAELEKTYPDARPELNFRNPYETLVAVMLSAQCTD